jgi:TatD DNase family protein
LVGQYENPSKSIVCVANKLFDAYIRKRMIIVDSHCHLDMLQEHDALDNYIERAHAADVRYLQTICTRIDNFDNILKIAKRYDNVFASVGVHPSEVENVIRAEELIELAKDDKVIGLGETGLDYFYNKEPEHHRMQQDSFEQHIIASQGTGLPVIVHTRDAESDTANIIAGNKKSKNFKGLIHCFTASKEFAAKMLDLDMFISIAGIVTFKNAEDLREVVRFIPLNRILVETDSPYLAPVPKRGKVNEPAYTRFVAEFIAELKEVTIEKVAEQTTENFFSLFDKAKVN